METFIKPDLGIVLPSFEEHDAISNEVCLMYDWLMESGRTVEIFVEKHPVRTIAQYPRRVKYIDQLLVRETAPQTILFQFSCGSDVPKLLSEFRGKIITRFHNITPPQFFDAETERETVRACERGYTQMPLVRLMSDGFLNISDYNSDTFGLNGDDRKNKLPVLRGYGLANLPDNQNAEGAEFKAMVDSASGKKLLTVGRVVRHKRVHQTVAAFKILKKKFADAKLLIVGNNGSEYCRKELAPFMEKLGLSFDFGEGKGAPEGHITDRWKYVDWNADILFLTALPDSCLGVLYETADLYLSASAHEGYGVPFIEAIRAGLPLVIPKVGIATELDLEESSFYNGRSAEGLAKSAVGSINKGKVGKAGLQELEKSLALEVLKCKFLEEVNKWISGEGVKKYLPIEHVN